MFKTITFILVLWIGTLGCAGKTTEEIYSNGVELLRAGKTSGAIVFFKNALEKNQNFLEARYQLGRALMLEKKYDLAEKEYQKIKLLNPNHPEINLDLARLQNLLGKPDLAIRSAEEQLLGKSDSADALEVIGIAYDIKNMPQEAETYFERALQLDPSRLTTKLELATHYARYGEVVRAGGLLEKIVSESPANSRSLSLLADIELARGRKLKALTLYNKAGEIEPENPVFGYKAGLLHFELKHYAIAESIANDLIKKFPSHADGNRLKGIISYRNKKYPEAITLLQHANKLQSTVSGHFFLGLSLYNNGDLESAMNHFRLIIDRAPKFHQARLLVGVIHLQQRRFDDAITELTRLIEEDAANSQAHNMLGSAYMAKGLYEEGLRELDVATKLDPKLIEAYLKKGILHLSRGRTSELEADLTTAIKIAPEVINTRLILSLFYDSQNNRNKALATLQDGLTGDRADAVLYCGMSKIMFADNRPDDALKTLNKAKVSDSSTLVPFFMLARYFTGVGDLAKALNEYSGVMQKDPHNVPAMLKTALIMEMSGRFNDALVWYLKAKETLDPMAIIALARFYEKSGDLQRSTAVLVEAHRTLRRSGDILEEMVRLHLKNKQYSEALKACDNIESISAERAASRRVSIYLAMKKMPEALQEAQRVTTLRPDSAFGQILLASVYKQQNHMDKAIELLEKNIQHNGHNPQLVLALADLYSKSGNHTLAIRSCDELLRKSPGNASVYFAQGTFFEAQGLKDEAIKKFRAAVTLSNDYCAAINNLSYLCADGRGTQKESLCMAERAIMLDPDNPRVIDTLGYALLKNNRYQDARKNLERAAALLPDDPTINYHLGLCLQALGDKSVRRLSVWTRASIK